MSSNRRLFKVTHTLLAVQAAVQHQKPEVLLAPAHLIAILLTEDKGRGSASAFVRNVQDAGDPQCA